MVEFGSTEKPSRKIQEKWVEESRKRSIGATNKNGSFMAGARFSIEKKGKLLEEGFRRKKRGSGVGEFLARE